jgi:hypothetical protein
VHPLHTQPRPSVKLTDQPYLPAPAMRLPPKKVDFEVLRARYAELLRLREYAERLETIRNEKTAQG